MDPTTEDLYRFGVALAIGAMIGVERQFSGSHEQDEEEGATRAALLTPPSEGQMRAAVAAAEQHPPEHGAPAAPAPEAPPRRLPDPPAGVRTFTLFSLSGAATAYLAPSFPWLFSSSLLVVGALVLAGYYGGLKRRHDIGLTSEISSIITFLLGAMAVTGHTTVAGACAVVVTGLLALKRTLHRFTWHIKQEDILAALKFAVISVVILPVLPEDPIVLGDYVQRRREARAERAQRSEAGAVATATTATSPAPPPAAEPEPPAPPRGEGQAAGKDDRPWWHHISISPRKVWYMVVLISGVSFAGYVLVQVLGTSRGLVVTGIFGGIVSSTAVSLSFAQRSRESPELSPRLAMGIVLANAIMPVRLLAIIVLIDPLVALSLALPLMAMVLTGGLVVLWLHVRRSKASTTVDVKLKNPFEITPALKIGAVFAVVLLLAQLVQQLFGTAGLYVLGFLSGLTDVDAIGLAMTNQAADGRMPAVTAAIVVALAVISNTLFKAGWVVARGDPGLRRITVAAFAAMLAAAVGGVFGARALFG